jgi:hypothetical protein
VFGQRQHVDLLTHFLQFPQRVSVVASCRQFASAVVDPETVDEWFRGIRFDAEGLPNRSWPGPAPRGQIEVPRSVADIPHPSRMVQSIRSCIGNGGECWKGSVMPKLSEVALEQLAQRACKEKAGVCRLRLVLLR